MDFQSEKSFGKLRLRAFQPYHHSMYVEAIEDVEDRSNTHKGCNAMYVEDVEQAITGVYLSMSKMSKIDQIHIRAVMLCMSKTSKMGKEHTHTFWLITSLILNGFSIRKKFWKAET